MLAIIPINKKDIRNISVVSGGYLDLRRPGGTDSKTGPRTSHFEHRIACPSINEPFRRASAYAGGECEILRAERQGRKTAGLVKELELWKANAGRRWLLSIKTDNAGLKA